MPNLVPGRERVIIIRAVPRIFKSHSITNPVLFSLCFSPPITSSDLTLYTKDDPQESESPIVSYSSIFSSSWSWSFNLIIHHRACPRVCLPIKPIQRVSAASGWAIISRWSDGLPQGERDAPPQEEPVPKVTRVMQP